ncbi:hypothetical protein ElyMa_000424000 [Elysia marginata]|uniref:Uncharacterized protein n=1 Tax=Elysia marginata TaxID=1093978 RepID=A0AAV4FPC7_9GAST|nr:hypothetical protein ElyMa_000424000 [Elysia marginata]
MSLSPADDQTLHSAQSAPDSSTLGTCGNDQTTNQCTGLEFTDIAFALRRIEAELDRPYREWLAARETCQAPSNTDIRRREVAAKGQKSYAASQNFKQ